MANSKKSVFRQAVENTPEIKDGYCSGLKAVKGSERTKITADEPAFIDGSVDIDSCVLALYPDDARWDYAISFKGQVCFLEIHPACDKEIKKMNDKLQWLKRWLKTKAPQIDTLPRYSKPFCWVPSGGTGFLSTSVSRKKIALLGISYENRLELK